MKKLFFAVLIASLTTSLFVSCIDQDDEIYEHNIQNVDPTTVKPPTGG